MTEVLADHEVRAYWSKLDATMGQFVDLRDQLVREGSSAAMDATLAIRRGGGIADILDGCVLEFAYSGDQGGGTTELVARIGPRQVPYLSAITFSHTHYGSMAAFYYAHVLPTKGIYWHGAYGRDYAFIFTKEEREAVIRERYRGAPLEVMLRADSLEPGLSIVPWRNGTTLVSCIAATYAGDFYEHIVHLFRGNVLNTYRTQLVASGVRVFY